MRNGLILALVATGCAAITTTATAQNDAVNELYGNGYHAYYRHDLNAAEQFFNSALAEGSEDPRVYYYRGLSYMKQGRLLEAEADFREGALHEAEGHGRQVGRALERVQGPSRLRLEIARAAARLEVAQRRAVAPPTMTPRQLPAEPAAPQRDPFADRLPDTDASPPPVLEDSAEDPVPTPPTDVEPTPPQGEIDESPDAAPPTEPADDDPFGGDPFSGDLGL